MPSFFIKTYGCQMNERDSEQVARQLVDRGYLPAADEHAADVVLLNTCSVRDQAEQKALNKMAQLQGEKKKQRPEVVLGFMGCMAQSRGGELARLLPGVDLVVGTQKYHRVADYIDTLVKREKRDMDNLRATIVDTAEEAGSQNTIRDHDPEGPGATAFVSIMQGCNMHCAFCIVPSTRGAERSRPQEEILAEVRSLTARGVKEVTLLGQIVNLYGRTEFPRVDGRSPFTQLLYALQEVEGLERIRFTSPHPIGYKKDLVQAFRDLSKLCEHVHLPLQSGSDRILKAMGRGYTARRYRELVEEMRAACPGLAITTDIIVGYPGETESDYLETRRLVEEVGFDNAFIFRYSERRGTPAASLPDQLPDETKEARNQDLLAVLDRIAEAKGRELLGQTVEILVEGPSKTNASRLSGRTRTNKPVIFEGDTRHLHQLLPVKIVDTTGFTHYGDPVIHG
ncbi:MAG: tRNA (N6-isopentenyl adenosine(37)-C2)-methylthiotransferase MiaB [Candidatus Methylacidiphilales bacterium]|nr:tRNA (N6-isopentenyl adenosine(37)-C2)-methylthiotransferase MiaB [Candidatus Methylacidiphilales bacterium]